MTGRDQGALSEGVHSVAEEEKGLASSGSEPTEREHKTFRTERLDHVSATNRPQETTHEIKEFTATSASPKPFGTEAGSHEAMGSMVSSPTTRLTTSSVDSIRPDRVKSFQTGWLSSVGTPSRGLINPWTATNPTRRIGDAARTDPRTGPLDGGRTTTVQLASGCVAGFIVILLILFLLLVFRWKRRRTNRFIVACSNPDAAFDNLGMARGIRMPELGDLELVKVKLTKTVKRKVSIFDKEESYGKIQNLSCGRLDLIEITTDEDSSLPDEV